MDIIRIFVFIFNIFALTSDSSPGSDKSESSGKTDHEEEESFVEGNLMCKWTCTTIIFKIDGRTNAVNNVVFKTLKSSPDQSAHDYLRKKKYRERISQTPPFRPKGGQVFLFKNNFIDNKVIINDGYSWRLNKSLKSNKGITRNHYHLKKFGTTDSKDSRFQRFVYFDAELPPVERVYLIYYYGDEKAFIEKINEKTGQPVVRTDPKVFEKIKAEPFRKPQKLYADICAEVNEKLFESGLIHSETLRDMNLPKDPNQVRRHQHMAREKLKISKDSIYNCY